MAARTHHCSGAFAGFQGFNKLATRFLVVQKLLKPRVLAGNVVNHQISHNPGVLCQRGDIVPVAQFFTHARKIRDGKSIVRAKWVKRQYVYCCEVVGEVLPEKTRQSG